MFYVVMKSSPMVKHNVVGPGRCTPYTTHDDVSELYRTYGPSWKFTFGGKVPEL